MKKNIGRKIAIVLLAIVCVTAAIIRLKIEPASYKKTLKNQVKKAEDLLSDADIGNDKNQYSNYVILDFKNEIKVAKKICDDKNSYYDIEKSAYEQLKSAVKEFKKNKNNNCISKDDIKKLKDSSKKSVKTAVLNSKYNVIWSINGKNINKSAAINLDAKTKSPYTNRVDEYIDKLELKCKKISFYHNGKLPVEAKIYVNYKYDSDKDKIYLYKFNTKDNTLEYKSEALVNESNIEFNINEGGDYILLKNKLESYASKEEIKSISKEIKQNENKLDLKNKKEKIEEKDTTSKKNSDKKNTESKDSTKKDKGTKKESSSETKNDNNDKNSGDNANSNTSNNTTTNNKDNNQGNNQENNNTQPSDNNQEVNKKVTCTIEIRCDTLVGSGKLQNASKENYVPSDGTILSTTTVTVDEGKTVYDVLLSVCRNYNIQIDAEYTQTYASYYVKGLGYLYEFDGGNLSGWMYSVNGDFPNYGCSSYKVKNGDTIKWLYTCDMGTDIGEDHSDWT